MEKHNKHSAILILPVDGYKIYDIILYDKIIDQTKSTWNWKLYLILT